MIYPAVLLREWVRRGGIWLRSNAKPQRILGEIWFSLRFAFNIFTSTIFKQLWVFYICKILNFCSQLEAIPKYQSLDHFHDI